MAEQLFGTESENYLGALLRASIAYKDMQQYDKALVYALEVLKGFKKELSNHYGEHVYALLNAGQIYYYKADDDSALQCYLAALKIAEEKLGENHPIYVSVLEHIGNAYTSKGEYEKSLEFQLRALNIAKKYWSENGLIYADCLKGLASTYYRTGQYGKAEQFYADALKILENTLGKENQYYSDCLLDMANLYRDVGKYDDALSFALHALENIEKQFGKYHFLHAEALTTLGSIYQVKDQFDKALPVLIQAVENTERGSEKNDPGYAKALNSLGSLYELVGQYDKALPLYLKSVEATEMTYGKQSRLYLIYSNNLANIYAALGKYSEALEIALQVAANTKLLLGEVHPEYGLALMNLVNNYRNIGKYDAALKFQTEATEIIGRSLGNDHPSYGTSLSGLSAAYSNLGDYEKALFYDNKALLNAEKTLGRDHSVYGIRLSNLATLYNAIEQYQKAYPLYQQANQNQLNFLHKTYNLLSEQEKQNFNETILDNLTAFHGFTYHARHEVPEAMEEDLLVTLATSGLLLNSSRQMREAVWQSGDTALQNLYDDWMLVNKQVDLAESLTIDERSNRGLDLAALQSKANDIERELVQQSAGLLDIPDYTIGKAEVSHALSKGEAAIQFNSFAYRNPKEWTDSVLYVAYIITPGGGLQYIPLFEEKQLLPLLKGVAKSDTLEKVHELVWKPLLPYLQGVSMVYYAPSGLLNKVPFAAVSSTGKGTPDNALELRCLLSVRDLPALKEKETPVAAGGLLALFGGADFNYLEKPANEQDFMYAPLAFGIADSLRGSSWGYLKGSLEEVNQINAIAARSGLKTVQYTGTEASEAHLVSVMKEKKPSVLHVATHGYYVPSPKRKPESEPAFAMLGDKQPIRNAENPLLRSGLLLAGANQKWQHNKNTDAENDGILTAQEISRMDLSNTQLVVLSACETGLGDITHSEGVYGMQRAFRIAGAKKMIVSLWKVPDNATAEMMELFYTALLQKKQSAHQSFRYAQDTMRQKYPDNPVNWAGFVLVE